MVAMTERSAEQVADPVVAGVIPAIQQKVDELLERWRVPGAAVGIVRDQELVWSGGFGFADTAAERVPDEHTIYRIGSITKTFTGTAIVQLRDEGRLRLDDPLVKFIPEFEAARARFGSVEDVTLRRLLTHRSGLMGEPPLDHWETLEFPSIEEVVASLPGVEVVIEPDSAFKYSNLAFTLLGEVVARVSRRPYTEYIHAEILAPLGMNETAFALTDALRPQMATGYMPDVFTDDPEPAPHPLINGMASAGQLYSTVHDLGKWIAQQFRTEGDRGEAQVLAGRSIAEMHQPLYMEPGWGMGYALAWMAFRRGDNVYVGHGGGIHGFVTQVLFNEQYKTGAIALLNSVGPADQIAGEVLERVIAAQKEDTQRAARGRPAPTPPEWRRFLGYYAGAIGGPPMQVQCRDGRLQVGMSPMAQAPALPPTLLEPTDDPLIFMATNGRYAGEPLAFRVDPEGAVIGFKASGFAYKKLREAGG
jgi:D-alanyl-D-alanine carboxypeptidase